MGFIESTLPPTSDAGESVPRLSRFLLGLGLLCGLVVGFGGANLLGPVDGVVASCEALSPALELPVASESPVDGW